MKHGNTVFGKLIVAQLLYDLIECSRAVAHARSAQHRNLEAVFEIYRYHSHLGNQTSGPGNQKVVYTKKKWYFTHFDGMGNQTLGFSEYIMSVHTLCMS